MIEYVIQFSADLRKAAPGIGKVFKPVDDVLTKCGVGKLGVRGRLLRLSIKGPKALTKKERDKVKAIALGAIQDRFPSWAFQVESMRRKSRKSRSQSNST